MPDQTDSQRTMTAILDAAADGILTIDDHGLIESVNPALEKYINWVWFTVSQIAFGLAAGAAIARVEPVGVAQSLSLAGRAGLEATGIVHDHDQEGPE